MTLMTNIFERIPQGDSVDSNDEQVLVQMYNDQSAKYLYDQVLVRRCSWNIFYNAAKDEPVNMTDGTYELAIGRPLSSFYFHITPCDLAVINPLLDGVYYKPLHTLSRIMAQQLHEVIIPLGWQVSSSSFASDILGKFQSEIIQASMRHHKPTVDQSDIDYYAALHKARKAYLHEVASRAAYETHIERYHGIGVALYPPLVSIIKSWLSPPINHL